jgi:hypothetical protein
MMHGREKRAPPAIIEIIPDRVGGQNSDWFVIVQALWMDRL